VAPLHGVSEDDRHEAGSLGKRAWVREPCSSAKEDVMKKGERLVVVGCGGVGAPAAMLSKKLMPEVDVTVIREEREFIVR